MANREENNNKVEHILPGSFAVRPHTFDGKLQSTGQIEKQLQIKEKKKAFDFELTLNAQRERYLFALYIGSNMH